ncbi:uncharacterized protein (TIGR04222 family) [Archangium gephyra]|uniref:Uncharacterized protein (TIGR04222 family) n=1 Tax=Archangium gephyra TaxID=48 RepID=A0AAC8Q0X5_9BACT|nr:TIGR04222 domain-containing membrane protein [Archangium gephyra]AKI98937.1 Hypothetical protein AA314_00564 [Archangium gephyra]REG30848.1 uncharacterized protein (TIGR04222 family) [Archangium gephyra]
MNPLDWNGEQFLEAYLPFGLVMLIAASLWRSLLKWSEPSEEPRPGELELDPYQVAMLERREGGVRAAVAALVHAGALRFESGVLKAVDGPPLRLLPFERAVYEAVAGGLKEVSQLETKLSRELDRMEEGLRQRGLLLSPEMAERYKYPRFLFYGVALGLGGMKLLVGLWRDKPVGYLVIVILFGMMMGSLLLQGAPRRTKRGDKALAMLRRDNEALRTTAKADGAWGAMSSGSVAMAVALFGTGLLAASGMGDLRDYLVPPGSGGSDIGGDSGGGGDGGGDGGSSCGGGGCGGCGGGGGD